MRSDFLLDLRTGEGGREGGRMGRRREGGRGEGGRREGGRGEGGGREGGGREGGRMGGGWGEREGGRRRGREGGREEKREIDVGGSYIGVRERGREGGYEGGREKLSPSLPSSLFLNNTSKGETKDTSAIAAFRFPITFGGINRFLSNVGGGVTLLNTQMKASGVLVFDKNTAVFGGGIAMDDRCLVTSCSGLCMCMY